MGEHEQPAWLRDSTGVKLVAVKLIGDAEHFIGNETLGVTEDRHWFVIDGNGNFEREMTSDDIQDWLISSDDKPDELPTFHKLL